jgi:hypothetical protein
LGGGGYPPMYSREFQIPNWKRYIVYYTLFDFQSFDIDLTLLPEIPYLYFINMLYKYIFKYNFKYRIENLCKVESVNQSKSVQISGSDLRFVCSTVIN